MSNRGQATIEFTFSMIIILFLIFGLVRIFGWAGKDLAERRVAHDKTLLVTSTDPSPDPERQLNPDFYRPQHLNAIYQGNIVK